MNGPSLQTALLSAANLLSFGGTIVPMYFLMRSGYSLHRVADAGEDDALLLQVLLQAVVDLLALVDRTHAGEELPLRLWDAQLLEGVPDLRRDVLPLLRGLLRGLRVVVEVVELYRREVDAPRGDWPRLEVLQRLQPELLHPDRLVSQPRDLLDDVLVYSLVPVVEVAGRVGEAVLCLVIVCDDVGGGCHITSLYYLCYSIKTIRVRVLLT